MSMKFELLTAEDKATIPLNEQDAEWSRRWDALSDDDQTTSMNAIVAEAREELRQELPCPELVLDKVMDTAQAWLAHFLATITVCDRPSSINYVNKMLSLATPTMEQLFGVKASRMLIHRARRLAGIESYRDPETGEMMWVRRAYE